MSRFLGILIMWVGALSNALAVGHAYDQQTGIGVYWNLDDMCGVFTERGTEIIHWVTDGNKNNATLSAYGWSLVPNARYCAYYPYSQTYIMNSHPQKALPISFIAQSQKENNNINHLAKYDFMTAQATSSTDACHFSFSHLGSIVRLVCKMQETVKLKSVALTSQKADFTIDATMNVHNGIITPVKRDSVMMLDLNDVAIGVEDSLVAYMMLPPTDLTDSHLSVVLTDSEGRTTEADLQGTKILAGHVYPVTLQMPMFADAADKGPAEAKKSSVQILAEDNIKVMTTDQDIDRPTVYVPDFTLDEVNSLRQVYYLLGDVNNDGEVKMSDASMLVNRCLDGTAASLHKKVADVDGDGKIDIEDSKAIMNIFLNN